jgi:hypothetical protein
MAVDLKAATPDTTFALATAFLFGADSQSASNPSIYAASDVFNAFLAAANTFTAKQTITPAANTEGLVVSSYSLTGANAQSLLDLSGTWNTTGVPTGLKLNITNTAAGSGSKIADFQSSGVTALAIFRNSDKFVSVENAYALLVCSGSRTGGNREIQIGGSSTFGIALGSGVPLSWYSGTDVPGNAADLTLVRDAANTLAQRRTTNAQTQRWYRTFTDSSNYERVAIQTGSGYGELAVESAGTGTANMDLRLTPVGTGVTRTAASFLALSGTAIPAGGTAGAGLKVSSTSNFGVFFGSGAPTLSAAKGSLYLRSDGSGTTDRAYINTDGSTTWTALTTAA